MTDEYWVISKLSLKYKKEKIKHKPCGFVNEVNDNTKQSKKYWVKLTCLELISQSSSPMS